MNRWYRVPQWAVDRERLCFVEVGDSRQYAGDGDMTEGPRPGLVVAVVD